MRLQKLLLTLALALAACTTNQTVTSPAAPRASINYTAPVTGPNRYMFENEISPGMTGYGLTVMHGGKIEPFGITVLDVVKDLTPQHHAILVRCHGLNLEHSGIIAGMSGSPCFINGRMIGAIAFGWALSKDPIAGIQPIRQMLELHHARPAETQAAGGATWRSDTPLQQLATQKPGWQKLLKSFTRHTAAHRRQLPSPGQGMAPLASPLMVSGLSPDSFKLLENSLAATGLVPIASGSGSGASGSPGKGLGGIAALKPGEIQLQPGSAVAVPLVTGDMDISALGTVTEVADNRVFAFGHAFLAQGPLKLPMNTGYVYTVMPNLQQSFKLGTSLTPAGTLTMDEQAGVLGTLGPVPSQVPVTITVKSADASRDYRYRISQHPRLTPVILNAILHETLTARRHFPQQFTARITGEARFTDASGANPRKMSLRNLGVTESFDPAATLLPVAILVDNPFENLQLTNLTINAAIEPRNQGAVLRSVTVDRLIAAPGDELHIVAEIERFQQPTIRLPITFKIPVDAEEGEHELMVGPAAMALMQESDYAPQRFDPTDIRALEKAVERILSYASDHVYTRLVMGVSGASLGGIEKPDLPPSRMALYASSRRTDADPVLSVITTKTHAGAIIESGGQSFNLRIDRRANLRYFSSSTPPGEAQPGPRRKTLLDAPRPAETRPKHPQE